MALISDPSLQPSDFRAHGLRGDKSKRYSVKNFICTVQPPGSDVWSRAHRLLNSDWVQFNMTRDNDSVTLAWRSEFATASLSGRDLKLGDLIRHLPEMARDVVAAGWAILTWFTFRVSTTERRPTHPQQPSPSASAMRTTKVPAR